MIGPPIAPSAPLSTFIVVNLPLSRDGVRAAMIICTAPASPPSWVFRVAAGGPPAPTEHLVALATDRFGGPRHRARTHTEWNVAPGAVDHALDMLGTAGPDAVTSHGDSLAALTCGMRVDLLDPLARAPYPDITPDTDPRVAVSGQRLFCRSCASARCFTAVSRSSRANTRCCCA